MADYNASVPPPPAHPTSNAAKPVNASKATAPSTGTGTGSSAKRKLEKSLKFMNFGLLAWIAFAWLSWLIFLAGVSAVTSTGRDIFTGNETQNTVGFSWLCLWALFFILLALTLATLASLTSKSRHLVSLMTRGMLFFLAIIISWLGVDAHSNARRNRDADSFGSALESRYGALLAGEIMCLIAALLIALTLLLMDQARSHSNSSEHGSLKDAAASAVGGNEGQPSGGGPVGTYSSGPPAHV